MRLLLVLCAVAMPAVAWLSQQGVFGPDNGSMSDRYPTLLVAAGYAFAIWGPIFLLDVAFAAWQLRARQRDDAVLARIRPAAAMGFALTALWMPVFSQQVFWLALLLIWAALACLLYCALQLSRDGAANGRRWAWLPLSLHAGWLSLAVFLNTAQVVVAYQLLSRQVMLPWSLPLLAACAALLLAANQRMRGNLAYVLAALWGLAAVYVKQSQSLLTGADAAAWMAVAAALVLLVQTIWLCWRRER